MQTNMLNFKIRPNKYYMHQRSEILEFVPLDAKKILDIGCGNGNFGYLLKTKRNAEVWGIEKVESAVSYAASKLNNVIKGDIERDNIVLPQNYFDCIIFNDVLEHLVEPWNVLKNCANYLRNKGVVVASIPNVRYLPNIRNLIMKKDWKYANAGTLDQSHLRFFTEKSIIDLFCTCGYRVLSIKGINGSSFSWKFRLLNRLLFKNINDMMYQQFVCVAKK